MLLAESFTLECDLSLNWYKFLILFHRNSKSIKGLPLKLKRFNMLAIAFKCYQMGLIVGEETGGVYTAFGDVVNFQLPTTKLQASSSHKKFVHPCNDGKLHGVIPDVKIVPTINDFHSGRDAAIEYILSTIK